MEDAHLPPRHSRCGEHGQAKHLLVDSLRAGEGKEDASFTNLLKGFGVESLIALERVLDGTTMLGKSRWVKDNEVVLIFIVFQEMKCIVHYGRMIGAARKIAGHVLPYQLDGFLGAIYRIDFVCSSGRAYTENPPV